MKRLLFLHLRTIVLLLLCLQAFTGKAQITLENSKLKLVTDGKHIISLYDKVRSVEHISGDYVSANGLFGVNYVVAGNMQTQTPVNANVMTNVSLLNSTATSASYLLENPSLKATVGIVLNENMADVSWTISVEMKNTAQIISQIDFPRMRTPQKSGNDFKEFLEPCVEGQTRLLSQAIQYWRVYPGSQTVQIGIVTFDKGGFSMWTDDTKGYTKSFGYLTGNGSANFAVRHFVAYGSSNWQLSYATHILLHGSEWQDGADVYRDWASKQTWCKTQLKDRTDVSELLHSPPLVISTQLDKETLSTLPARLKSWETMFGARIIYRPLGWEKYGNWVGPDYFPSKIGDDHFKNVNAQLKAAGISVAGFPEPYDWVKGLTDGSASVNEALAAFYNQNNGAKLCRTDATGNVYTQTNEKRLTSYICRGTDYGKNIFQSVAKSLFDLGVTHMHDDADHMTGLGGPCFNSEHGHPIAYGNWETEVMNQVFGEIKAEAKKRNLNDFILSRENGFELQNMILTGYQTRNFHILSERKNIKPLFTYIYHDYIPAIFGLATANAKRNILLCGLIVYGQIPSISFWSSVVSEPTANVIDQISANVLKDYYDVMKTHGKDFLLYGKMQRPLLKTAPGTIHNTWEDKNGDISIFAIDTLDTNTNVTFTVPGTAVRYLSIYNGSTLVSKRQVAGGETVSWELPKWRLCSAILTNHPVSVITLPEKNKINIFPNPVKETLNITMIDQPEDFEVSIFDSSGRKMGRFGNKKTIPVKHFESGMYILALKTNSNYTFQKFTKL